MYINGQELKIRRYSSGELKLLRSELNKYITENKVEILHTNDLSMFELFLIIDYYNSNNILVDLILTYLPYQRMDHDGTNEVNTLINVARMLNKACLNSLTICEPHSSITDFNNAVEFSYINHLKHKVFADIGFDENTDTVILTDKGGFKRYGKLSKNIGYFNKVRDKNTGLITHHEIVGNVKTSGKVVIVDDIISSGDTIINVVNILASKGAKEIYVFCGHFEKNRFNNRLLIHKDVKMIFSTNSLRKKQTKKLKLYKTEEIFYGREND